MVECKRSMQTTTLGYDKKKMDEKETKNMGEV